jgi:hypothetical protein
MKQKIGENDKMGKVGIQKRKREKNFGQKETNDRIGNCRS